MNKLGRDLVVGDYVCSVDLPAGNRRRARTRYLNGRVTSITHRRRGQGRIYIENYQYLDLSTYADRPIRVPPVQYKEVLCRITDVRLGDFIASQSRLRGHNEAETVMNYVREVNDQRFIVGEYESYWFSSNYDCDKLFFVHREFAEVKFANPKLGLAFQKYINRNLMGFADAE